MKNSSPKPTRRWPSGGELPLILPLVAVLWVALVRQAALLDTDYFWHLRVGQLLLTGGWLTNDPFSWTFAGAAWRPHEWLADVVWAGLYGVAGHSGPVLGAALLALAAWLIAYYRARWLGVGRLPALALLLLGILAVAPLVVPRPHLWLWLSASLTALIIERVVLGGRRRWLLALLPLAALAANFHSAAPPLMAAVVGVALGHYTLQLACLLAQRPPAGAPTRPWSALLGRVGLLLGVLAAVIASGALTPAGPAGLAQTLATLTNPAPRLLIEEWQSPNFHRVELRPFEIMLLGGLILFGRWGLRRPGGWAYGLLLVGGTALAALESARHIPLYALLAGPWLVAGLPLTGDSTLALRRPLAVGLVVIGLAIAAIGLVSAQPGALREREAHVFPAAAADWLAARPAADRRLMHEYDWGGYLIWRQLPVFVDGRAEVFYPSRFLLATHAALAAEPRWSTLVLTERQANAALLRPTTPLVEALQAEGWAICYRDAVAVVLQPRCP